MPPHFLPLRPLLSIISAQMVYAIHIAVLPPCLDLLILVCHSPSSLPCEGDGAAMPSFFPLVYAKARPARFSAMRNAALAGDECVQGYHHTSSSCH